MDNVNFSLTNDHGHLQAGGELEGQTSVGANIYYMLLDAAKVLAHEGKPEPFRRMTVTFENVQYRATIATDTLDITIVKCANV